MLKLIFTKQNSLLYYTLKENITTHKKRENKFRRTLQRWKKLNRLDITFIKDNLNKPQRQTHIDK